MAQRSVFEGKPSHRFGLALPAPCGAPPKGELEINERKDNDYEQLQHSAVCRNSPELHHHHDPGDEFRKYDSLPKASTPLTEGVTPDGQALNVTTITSDLHQYGGWTPLTDVLQMTAIDNNVVQATRVLASQAGRTMDSITRDVLAGGHERVSHR